MGSFYTNVTLRTTDEDRVAEALRANHREAYVARPQNGCVVVYDSETEDQDIDDLKALASALSEQLRCPALAVLVHDDDVLVYTLHEGGKVVDEYVSAPAYFDTAVAETDSPEGGDATRLCRAFGADGKATTVDQILRTERAGGSGGGFIFETDRHQELVEALGIPEIAVSTGYNYIEEGELPDGTNEGSFTLIS
jgi:hypothetical protein